MFQYPQRGQDVVATRRDGYSSSNVDVSVPSTGRMWLQRNGFRLHHSASPVVSVPSTGRMWLQHAETASCTLLASFSTLNGQDVVATQRPNSNRRLFQVFQYPQRAGCGCNRITSGQRNGYKVSVPSTGRMWLQPSQSSKNCVTNCFSTLNGQDVVATREDCALTL